MWMKRTLSEEVALVTDDGTGGCAGGHSKRRLGVTNEGPGIQPARMQSRSGW